MKKVAILVSSLLSLASVSVFAAGDYNDVPKNDAQYKQCLKYSRENYEGGDDKSPIKGQTKVEAFCECVWNETPEEFSGNLAKFAESAKGKRINKICEKYSNWGG